MTAIYVEPFNHYIPVLSVFLNPFLLKGLQYSTENSHVIFYINLLKKLSQITLKPKL